MQPLAACSAKGEHNGSFSQQFLANLGRPPMAQGLFGLGAASWNAPGQVRQRRKQEQFNQLMQQGQAAMASGDAAQLAQIGQQLTECWLRQKEQALTQVLLLTKNRQSTGRSNRQNKNVCPTAYDRTAGLHEQPRCSRICTTRSWEFT